ncbi:MAG TPA: nucleotidyl transferase AbiEii/AbiGii toxin family protein [Acidimicrobiales bacterium]|nr:nucleotidyl transferase AbiEii/AbiGii toxin family protein [Acidimicrobiales bacterium]
MARFADLREFGPTLDAAAEQLGISPTAVEKDYWVSQVLCVLGREFGGDFIFKGGTSLSKGYRLVERFSEDIDILIVPGERSRGATDKLMKAMAEAAAAGAGGSATAVGGSETGRHRSYEIAYPATREPTALIHTSVLLEMGVRGGPNPHAQVPISSLLGDALEAVGTDLGDFDDLAPFEVAVLHPGRTLLEKLVLIHALACQLAADIDKPLDRRSGRHFYDVYQLLGDGQVLALLADRGQTEQVMRSVEEINRAYFKGDGIEARPAGGFARCPAFDTASGISNQLRATYETTMPQLYFGSGPLPAWADICARVSENHALL